MRLISALLALGLPAVGLLAGVPDSAPAPAPAPGESVLIAEVLPLGLTVTAIGVRLDSPAELSDPSAAAMAFEVLVSGVPRAVVGAYTNTVAERTATGSAGDWLVLEIAQEKTAPGDRYSVTQKAPIPTIDGVIPASASAFEPGEVVTPLIDKYESREQVAPHATLKYRLFVPEPYDPDESYPLVLTLHGFGESGSDNELQLSANQLSTAFADPAWQKRHPAFVVSPQLDAGTGPGAWAQAHNQAALLAMLDSLREEFSIDSRRIYLVGLSMGSHGAWDLLGASPQTFAGALLIAYGGGPLVTLTDVPLWNIQSIDDDIVPYTSSVDAARVLEDAGAVVTHSEFPGNLSRGQATEAALEQWREADETQSRILFTAFTPQTTGLPGEPPLTGHPSWVDVFSNEVYLEWLFSKSRPPAPAPYASPGWPIAIAGVAGVLVATALVLWRRGKRARA